MEEKVSIIVPIYNMEKLLSRCINSIISQDYKNIEIILINDGSKDNSLNICNKYKILDNRIQVCNKENEGVSVARNRGIELSTGKWIMFVDPDDYLKPNIVSSLLKRLDKESDIISCSCEVEDGAKKIVCHFFEGDFITATKKEKNKLYLQLMDSNFGQKGKIYTAIGVPWGKLYRKDFLNKYNLRFKKDLKRMQDNIFNMNAFYYAKRIKYIDEPLYIYNYEHIKDFTTKYKIDNTIFMNRIVTERSKLLKETGLIEDKILYLYYIKESISFINTIISNIILDKINKKTLKDKIDLIKKYCNNDNFKFLQNEKISIKKLGLKKWLIITLIKNNLYYLLYFALFIKCKINLR